MKNEKSRSFTKDHSVLLSLVLLGLSSCNGNGQSEALNKESDWIDTTPTEAAPIPTPSTSSSPTPNPTSTSTTRPSPRPTSSSSPKPPSTPSPTPSVTSTVVPTGSDLYTGPAEVEQYVEKFVSDAKIQGVDVLPNMSNPKLEIKIASLSSYGSGVIGLCETGSGTRRVTFEPSFWNTASDTQRELLAHHELGHCILYRAHRNDTLSSGAYASIMYPVIMSSSTYTSNYNYYQNELFTWKSSSALQSADASEMTTHICNQEEILGAESK